MASQFNFGEATVIPDAFITRNCGDHALVELDKLIDGMLERGLLFRTAAELAEVYSR